MERLFTTYQVADLLGTNEQGVLGWIAKGWLESRKIGEGDMRVAETALVRFLRDRGIDLGSLVSGSDPEEAQEASDLIDVAAALAEPIETVEEVTAPVSLDDDEGALPSPAVDAGDAGELVSVLLQEAVRQRASHVHVDPTDGGIRIGMRIDGQMQHRDELESRLRLAGASGLVVRLQERANVRQDGAEGVGVITEPIDGRRHRVCVRTFPTVFGDRAVIELTDLSAQRQDLIGLGLNDSHVAQLKRALTRHYGLVVLVGPPGADRWRTLESLLAEAQLPGRDVVAVEGASELSLAEVVRCRAGGPDLSVGQALVSLRAQDADVIMVHDATDPAVALIDASLEGRLVLAGLLADSTVAALHMLLDGTPRWRLASGLSAIVNYRPIRKLCSNCKEAAQPDQEVLEALNVRAGDLGDGVFAAKGCDACSQTGYLGQTGVFSVMTVTERLADMIRRGADVPDVWLGAVREGTQTLLQAGLEKVRAGTISPDELARALSLVG